MITKIPPIPDLVPAPVDNPDRAIVDFLARGAPGKVRSTPLRLPHEVLEELFELARDLHVSRNAILVQFVDAGLRSFGRPGIERLAPWFLDHLKRNRKEDY